MILHILKHRTINKWKTKLDCVILHLKLRSCVPPPSRLKRRSLAGAAA